MSLKPILFSSHIKYVLSGLICILLVAVVGARIKNRVRNKAKAKLAVAETTAKAQARGLSQVQTSSEHIEAELVTVRPTGFDPVEIRRGPGPFFLAIENRSGTDLGPLSLVADAAGLPAPASRIAEARINKEKHNYGERLVLPPGRYRLGQQGGAGWSFVITITPH